jgi:heat shock protein HtpX
VQSFVLLSAMGGFLALLGWLLWGTDGILILLSVGVLGVLINPAVSPRLVMRLYGAQPVAPQQIPALWTAIKSLTRRAELPNLPELYCVPSSMLNAFAVGAREQAAIAVSDGLLRRLDLRELVGVLAHEISRIRNNDLWVMGLADMFNRATNMLSLMGQFLLLLNLPLTLFANAAIDWFAILLLILRFRVVGE